jgi:hypothetical protein
MLVGLLMCGACGRRMESAWSNGRAATVFELVEEDFGRRDRAHQVDLDHLPVVVTLTAGERGRAASRRHC